MIELDDIKIYSFRKMYQYIKQYDKDSLPVFYAKKIRFWSYFTIICGAVFLFYLFVIGVLIWD